MLQTVSVGAVPAPQGHGPKVDLAAFTVLVQQCFVAAGVPVPNVDASVLHGVAVGLGISMQAPDAGMDGEVDEHLSARSHSPCPGSVGPSARRASGSGRSAPYPSGLLPDLAKAALAATFLSPGQVGTQPVVTSTHIDSPTQEGGPVSGTTPSM